MITSILKIAGMSYGTGGMIKVTKAGTDAKIVPPKYRKASSVKRGGQNIPGFVEKEVPRRSSAPKTITFQ